MGTIWKRRDGRRVPSPYAELPAAPTVGQVQFDRRGPGLVVRLLGEIDRHAVDQIRARVTDVVARETTGPITVDLSLATFLDSSGLGMIAGMFVRSQSLGPLSVRGANETILRSFRVTGLAGVMTVSD